MSKEDAQLIEAVVRFMYHWLVLVALWGIMLSVQKIARELHPTANVEVTSEQEAKR